MLRIDLITLGIPKNYISPLLAPQLHTPSVSKVGGESWRRNDIWSGWHGEYTGSVTAGRGASLSGLAYLITRYAEDWNELNLPEAVEVGQRVSVAPLLKKFEFRVRASVIEATKKFNAIGFPPANSIGIVVGVNIGSGGAASGVNKYFSANAQEHSDCAYAGLVSLDKGLLDVVGNNLFNLITKLPDGGTVVSTTLESDLAENMWVGDMVQFPNYDDWELYHPNPEAWLWRGENVVKVGDNQYWGYVGANDYTVKTKQQWNNLLREAFNELNGPKREGVIPALNNKLGIIFPDIATIAMKLFDLRSKNFK